MSDIESSGCRHPDIRNFDALRCCMSCAFTLMHTALPQKESRNVILGEDTEMEAITPPKYIFKRLNYDLGKEIRLIRLQPGFPDEDLRCSVFHANLDDNPSYQAVSYTWADQMGRLDMSRYVVCENGTRITISANCAAVLRRIRAKGGLKPLWIDMLWIDQQSISERNHQVGLMDVIYRQADLVIVDVGDGDSSSDTVFDKIVTHYTGEWLPLQDAIEAFLHRRWFDRGWVLQEIALAKNAVVQCGNETLGWNSLKKFLTRYQARAVKSLPAAFTLDCSHTNLMNISGLIQTLSKTAACKVADPRDKIYAILGLCEEELRAQLPIDYAISTK